MAPVDPKPPSLHEGELIKHLAAPFQLFYPVSEEEVALDISTPDFVVCPNVDEEESLLDFSESPYVDEVGEFSNLHESFSQEIHQVMKEDITFKKNVDKSAEDGAYMQKWIQLQKYVPYLRKCISRLNMCHEVDKEKFAKLYSLCDLMQNPN